MLVLMSGKPQSTQFVAHWLSVS